MMGTMTDPEILTFSGTHPFRRQHAMGYGKRAAELLTREVCPRCEGPLYPDDREARATLARPGDPRPIWRPAGSKATACRCIPVCEVCGFAEALKKPAAELLAAPGAFDDIPAGERDRFRDAVTYVADRAGAFVTWWPVDRERQFNGVACIQAWMVEAGYGTADPSDPTQDLSKLIGAQHPGGWADPDN